MSAIERRINQARERISRVTPQQAAELRASGALLIDTRPVEQRRATGHIPGSLVIDRNVLEWRLDPTSPWRHPEVGGRTLVVLCQEGYSSSLAVESLSDLGVADVHDLAGGFLAWQAAGLPVVQDVGSGEGPARRML